MNALLSSEAYSSVVGLSDAVHPCGLVESRPERLGDLGDGVDPEPVDAVVADEVLDPRVERAHHVRVLVVQVWQARQPAVLHLALLTEIFDLAILLEK